MAAPVVQSLDQILAELEPAFGTTRNLYNQQISALPGAEQAAVQQLESAKNNSFRDIARSANTRGLDFWGTPIEEQQRYLGEKYLPGLTQVKANTQNQTTQLQLALAQLEREKYTTGLGRRGEQEKALQAFEAEQRRMAMERERMAAEDRRHQQSLAAQRASQPVDWGSKFDQYIAQKFAEAGGQGNRNITRQQQDKWAEDWFRMNGVVGANNRQGYWDRFNANYNRDNDATKDWRYKR